jgi:hypothetical protein
MLVVFTGMAIFVCERAFATPLTPEAFAAGGEKLGPCLAVREIKWVASHLAADGARSVCLFDAENAELVREANRSAGMPFERVWQATTFQP